MENYNRETELGRIFSESIQSIVDNHSTTGNNGDYYSILSIETLIRLKKALSNINNIITLKVCLAFVKSLSPKYISEDVATKVIKDILSTHANTNGYDVQCEDGYFPFLAEIKCNIPCGKDGKKFGAAQYKSIINDIDGLINGKSKASNTSVRNYYRFMVFLEYDGVRDAAKDLFNKFGDEIALLEDTDQLDKSKIYLAFIPLK
ncbi:MAG: hypothetical protein J6V27_02370 [Alistipes sp.]|nr:hypothetical protein [Alistipes sp.]